MTEHEVREKIAHATELVRSWPEWKRNILTQSAQPMFSSPRTPVNNLRDQSGDNACNAVRSDVGEDVSG